MKGMKVYCLAYSLPTVLLLLNRSSQYHGNVSVNVRNSFTKSCGILPSMQSSPGLQPCASCHGVVGCCYHHISHLVFNIVQLTMPADLNPQHLANCRQQVKHQLQACRSCQLGHQLPQQLLMQLQDEQLRVQLQLLAANPVLLPLSPPRPTEL